MKGGLVGLLALPCAAAQLMWGRDGHSLVAGMAQTLVKSDTATAISELLGGGQLDDISSWADDVRYYNDYSWSQPLHFVNAPDGECSYDPERDCTMDVFPYTEDYCVAGAISNYTTQLADGEASAFNRTEALMFLVHYVGDVSQPLHVSWAGDLGGNRIDVTFDGVGTNLHSLWDTKMIQAKIDEDYDGELVKYRDYLEQQIATTYAGDVAAWAECPAGELTCPHDWAAESLTLACDYAYAGIVSGDTISDEYVAKSVPVIEEQLCKGAVRLAANLDRAFAAAAGKRRRLRRGEL